MMSSDSNCVQAGLSLKRLETTLTGFLMTGLNFSTTSTQYPNPVNFKDITKSIKTDLIRQAFGAELWFYFCNFSIKHILGVISRGDLNRYPHFMISVMRKPGFRGFRPGLTQTRLHSHKRWLDLDFLIKEVEGFYYLCSKKKKLLISCAFIVQLICAFHYDNMPM